MWGGDVSSARVFRLHESVSFARGARLHGEAFHLCGNVSFVSGFLREFYFECPSFFLALNRFQAKRWAFFLFAKWPCVSP